MLKDESNTQRNNNVNVNKTPSSNNNNNVNEIQQQTKDRTLFCINIDQKCTEDILYELFLQAGPIDNIIRKADRNGNLICLITYKHIESCDYAIKLFNGISLFNQSLKVRPSDSSSSSLTNQQNNQPNNNRQNNSYQRAFSSNSSNRQNLTEQKVILSLPSTPQGLMPPPQQNLAHLFSQALNNLSPQIPDYSGLINPFQQQLNRSWSGSSINENDFNHQSRRTNYNNNNNFEHNRGSSFNNNRRNDYSNNNNNNNNSRGGGGNHFNDYNNTRDYSKQNNNNNINKQQDIRRDRSRSRSPIRKRNRR